MNDTQTARMADVVLAIEAELRRLDLWEEHAPSESDLHSSVPFCFDTLRFSQWLQWVFLPKMHIILQQGADLPYNSNIAPLAEEMFKSLDVDTHTLLDLIAQFDQCCANPDA